MTSSDAMPAADLASINRVLTALAREPTISTGPLESALARIIEAGANAMGVARANAWLITDGGLRCVIGFDARNGQHNREADIDADTCSEYLQAVRDTRVLVIDDAYTHPATREWGSRYLMPNGIGAMLDAPIHAQGQSIGVICFEHVGTSRRWHESEIQLVGSLSDFAALAIASDRQRTTERELGARDEMLEVVMGSAHDLVFTMTLEGIITYMSRPRGEIGELAAQATGRSWREYVLAEDQDQVMHTVMALMESNSEGAMSYRVRMPSGRVCWLEAHVALVNGARGEQLIAVIARDITERREVEAQRQKLERELMQAQRLETVGRLAGGVAHDFNNLLTVISGNIELATTRSPDSDVSDSLRQAAEACQRAARLTRQLLAFSRSQQLERTELRAGELIGELRAMLERVIREDITVIDSIQADLPPIFGDATRIEQVMMNLVVNAVDAMPTGGELHFDADVVTTTSGEVRGGLHREAGRWVRISVRDTGSGIHPDVLAHIFEPFFTTKPHEQGSGLGLSVSHGIIEQHGGWIEVDSQPGVGTRFDILLPISSATRPAHAIDTGATAVEVDARMARRHAILVVEDETAVLGLVEEILRNLGYRVTGTTRPLKALQLIETSPPFDLLITDVVMPEMDGMQLFERLQASNPELKVLYVSGYASNAREAIDADLFLQKPFNIAGLADKVRVLLRRSA